MDHEKTYYVSPESIPNRDFNAIFAIFSQCGCHLLMTDGTYVYSATAAMSANVMATLKNEGYSIRSTSLEDTLVNAV